MHSAAVPEFLSAQATAPYDRGLYLLRTDRQTYEDAITLFQEAARLDPRSPLPLAALVEAQIVKFDITKEQSCLVEAQLELSLGKPKASTPIPPECVLPTVYSIKPLDNMRRRLMTIVACWISSHETWMHCSELLASMTNSTCPTEPWNLQPGD